MNPVAEEMKAILEGDEDTLKHYGMPRRSGRYPYGSGEDPYQHGRDFLGRYEELKRKGLSEKDIAKEMGIVNEKGEPSTGRLRIQKSWAKDERRMLDVATAERLRDKEGLGATEIGRKMGIPESTVRSLLEEKSKLRMNEAKKTADFLKEQVKEKKMIDIGTGVEKELGISKEKLKEALYILELEGYPIYKGGIPQVTNPGKQINQKVLCVPGTEHKEIYNYDQVKTISEYTSRDGGDTFSKFVYPKSMDSNRLQIRYKEDGGEDKDGIVEIRRGVDDLSLGNDHYSQVRILVDDKKYIKGMAVYSDDMPDGVDVVFNTNKSNKVAKLDVLKDITNDPDNPFGSLIKAGGQSEYIDKNGKKQLSLINKRAGEGDWTEWKDALPSQFLGKQSKYMVKKQLDLAKADKVAEYDEICSLTNPTIKKHLLNKFADECDSAAVHLQAAALPGQKYHVIIPVNTLKDNEVYAPNYPNGTKVALIRYPHGGTFEIPILTVNNKHAPAKKLIGTDSIDAVGITKKNADRLSGADFDGDTVMVIPTHDSKGKVKITSKPPLKELEGFDPKMAYPERPGMKYMKDPKTGKDNTQNEMGRISNLITDMTLIGATDDELARAVRHSMVVIDAGKHKLDYKQSEIDNDIAGLKKRYQGASNAGAATILSRAKGQESVLKRQGNPKVNMKDKEWYDPTRPEGALIYKTADDVNYTYSKVDKKTGQTIQVTKTRKQQSTRMAETDDAYTLISAAKNPKEMLYADYANSMKALANDARKTMMTTSKIEYSKTAKDTYRNEVNSLMKKLNDAELNTTKERAAQRMANVEVDKKKQAMPDMKAKDIRKIGQQSITSSRLSVGSLSRRERNIDIEPKEWDAIQAGAISESKLKRILNNTDTAKLRELATPRSTKTLSTAQINKIKQMQNSGYTIAEIAERMGKSPSTVQKYMKGA